LFTPDISNKMRKTNILRGLITAFALISIFSVSAQKKAIAKADKLFEQLDYREAIYYFEIGLQKNAQDPYLNRQVGLSHRLLGQQAESLEWFEKAYAHDKSKSTDLLYMAEALKSQQRYGEAIQRYEEYAKLNPNDSRAQRHLKDDKYFMDLNKSGNVFNIRRLDLNDDYPAFGVSRMDEGYLFSSSGPAEKFGAKEKSVFTEQPYLDLYVGDKNEKDEIVNVRPIEGTINSKFHDGPATYDRHSGAIYVTRNNLVNGKPTKDKTGTIHLKIYEAKREKGAWTEVIELPFNSDDYSNAHPCMSNDGGYLYFVSNRPGGYGGTDIYRVTKTTQGWGKAENLGSAINTEGNEMFPFSHSDGSLFFSSDGHAGLGGLDVFQTTEKTGQWSEPENVGKPVNTYRDDFAMFYDFEKNTGYFSSNREGRAGDDIYWFEDLREKSAILEGLVVYVGSNKPVADTKLVYSYEGKQPLVSKTDANGRFKIELGPNENAQVDAMPDTRTVTLVNGLSLKSPRDLGTFFITELEPVAVVEEPKKNEPAPVEEKNKDEKGNEYTRTDLLANLKLNNIYFDYNSSEIKAESRETMKSVLKIMNENPGYRLEIAAHTDARGTSDYNEKLSRQRAENARQYLIKQGLSKERIVMNWYGKSKLEIDCPPGADCDELVHKANRRAEFKVIVR